MTITISEDCQPHAIDLARIKLTPLYEWQIGTRNAAQDGVRSINTERIVEPFRGDLLKLWRGR